MVKSLLIGEDTGVVLLFNLLQLDTELGPDSVYLMSNYICVIKQYLTNSR